jgi:hypothetical protein
VLSCRCCCCMRLCAAYCALLLVVLLSSAAVPQPQAQCRRCCHSMVPMLTLVCGVRAQVNGHVGYFDGAGPTKTLRGEFSLTSDTVVQLAKRRPNCVRLTGSGLRHKGGKFYVSTPDEATTGQWLESFQAHVAFVQQMERLDMDRVEA